MSEEQLVGLVALGSGLYGLLVTEVVVPATVTTRSLAPKVIVPHQVD